MALSPRAALVTGGTGRIGSAIVTRLDAEGFRVRAAGRRDGDLSRAEDARALVERTASELGALDLVVNAAGAGFTAKPVADVTEEDWDAALGATVKGSFFVTQAAAPHLRRSQLGLVVMIEDVAAYQPWPSFAAHCA
ncbi:MAG: SDR family oxidoreductase, partial [Actinomycetota bacterium]|nr:SDR family oxidoreductase [Actinomycetota bacterium]